MAQDDLVARAAIFMSKVEDTLGSTANRWVLVGMFLLFGAGLHALTGEPAFAWISGAGLLAAGLGGRPAFGLLAASVAAALHLGIDISYGVTRVEGISLTARTVILFGLALIGIVMRRIEGQRDSAVQRSVVEDPITGLLNVRAFYDGLAELRDNGTRFSLLLADVAGMRILNEEYGHPLGTEALRALGRALRRSVKRGDLVARLGGNEVAIALVGANQQGALAAANRLSALLAEDELHLPDGMRVQVHAYFGIACFPDDSIDEVGLLRAADHAVSDAKEQGPDAVVLSQAGREPNLEPGSGTNP